MRVIIPAKACSTRVPNKNYREFYRGKSLVDLLVEKLLRCFPPGDIYLSCEDAGKEAVAAGHGIGFLPRDRELTSNDIPMGSWIRGICGQVPGNDDIMWCECIDPLFDGHADCIDAWRTARLDGFDSLAVVYRFSQYLLDDRFQPIGWGFGPWHVKSQSLRNFHRLNFTCAILTRQSIANVGYMVGAKPYWYVSPNPQFVDIDTEDDFRIAQAVYAAIHEGN